MIADRYRALLQHLGPTRPLTSLRASTDSDAVALRHDIDHDLGVALDMSAMERSLGDRRATYFILHTQPYCEDPRFLDRLRRLVDDGHEIGLHLDALGAWWRGETDDPYGDLARWLDRVRGAGIEVVASAAHGARACYDGGFANHWIWTELRGDDPAATMDGISAEGIRVDDPAFQLRYPVGHRVERPDGAAIDLWSVSMSSLGIAYEACTVPVDRYWSDSGGEWKRSPDPTGHDLSRGRHQVLVHPWWWRTPRRTILVLSTARSGTKWLCGRIEADTSALVLHERMLNQHGSTIEPVAGLKRTAGDLVGLLEDHGAVERLVSQALAGHRRTNRDVFEANVYAAHVDPDLLDADDVVIVHLHRDPTRVVRSILERGWYDVPDDRRHPGFEVDGWEAMDRFERACTYWAETNRRLLDAFPDAIRVAVEDLQRDPEELEAFIRRIGLRPLGLPIPADGPVDRTTSWTVPPVAEWSARHRQVFLDRCAPVARRLGRGIDAAITTSPTAAAGTTPVIEGRRVSARECRLGRGRTDRCAWRSKGARWWRVGAPIVIDGSSGGSATFGLVRGAGWNGAGLGIRLRRLPPSPVLCGRLRCRITGSGFAGRLFAVELDRDGNVIRRTPLLRLDRGLGDGRFQIRLGREAAAVRPVVLVDAVAGDWSVRVDELDWIVTSEPRAETVPRSSDEA